MSDVSFPFSFPFSFVPPPPCSDFFSALYVEQLAIEILKVEDFYSEKLNELVQQLDLLKSQADATCALGEEKQRAKQRALALARQQRKLAMREKEARLLAHQIKSGNNASSSSSRHGLRNRANGTGRGLSATLTSAAIASMNTKEGGVRISPFHATASRLGDGTGLADSEGGGDEHSVGGISYTDGGLSMSFVEQVDRDLLTIRQEHEYEAVRSSIDLGM